MAGQRHPGSAPPKLVNVETRFRYNPDVKSLVALVPAVIPLLLILIPTMLTSLSVVREKEMGSIVNLYVTPVTRLEFLVGKQLPYIALGMVNYLLLVLLAVTVFGIPFKGSFFALTLAALLYVAATTAMGLLISTFMRSQIAAIFGSAVLTMLPAQKFSGMLDPVSSLEGGAALISDVYPMAHFLTISRGAFSKALGITDLPHPSWLVLTAPILLALSAMLPEETGELNARLQYPQPGHQGIAQSHPRPDMVALIAWSFSLAIYLGGSGVPETLNNAAIAIVDEDRSPLSQRIIDAFYPPYFIRPPLIAQPQMDEGMDAGRFTFALDIPPDFQRDVLAGRSPAIQLNVDATNMSQAWTGSDYIKTIVTDEVREFARSYRGAAASRGGTGVARPLQPVTDPYLVRRRGRSH